MMRWLARGEAQLPGDESWLSVGETARAAAMRFSKRRTEFLVARWSAKESITRLSGAAFTLAVPATSISSTPHPRSGRLIRSRRCIRAAWRCGIT
jgi:hypothetical protein